MPGVTENDLAALPPRLRAMVERRLATRPPRETPSPKQRPPAKPKPRTAKAKPAKPQSKRQSLPTRPPCVYEGKVKTHCHLIDDNRKLRDCEHPQADWDVCARAAMPASQHRGQNCSQCPLYNFP